MMMIAGGIFSESMALDVGVIVTILTGFSIIIGLLIQARNQRSEEIKTAVMEVINSQPDKIVVNPQPLLIAMQEKYVSRDDLNLEMGEIRRRLTSLETSRDTDRREFIAHMDGLLPKFIAVLKDTKGLL